MDRTERTHVLSMAVAAVAGLGLTVTTYAQTAGQGTGQQDRSGQQQADRAGDRIQAGMQSQTPRLPAGIEPKQGEADAEGVQKTIRDLANAALTENGFNDVGERLVDQDRNRWGENKPENTDELNAAAKKFRDAFKQKFGEDFDMTEGDELFTGIQVVEGEVKDPQIVASNWPVKQTGMTAGGGMGDEARTAGGDVGRPDRNAAAERNEQDSNIEEGRNVAVAFLPSPQKHGMGDTARSGQPGEQAGQHTGQHERHAGASVGHHGLTLSFVNEFPGSWKLDVPNQIQGQQVYTKLAERINKLADSPEQWPSDPKQVEKLVAHEVLACVVGADKSPGMQQPGMGQDRLNGQRDTNRGTAAGGGR